MPDSNRVPNDFDEWRGQSRRPWIVSILSVTAITIGLVWLLRACSQTEGKPTLEPASATSHAAAL